MSEKDQTIRCMLLPYAADFLILPSSSVSEIIGYSEPPSVHNKESWFLGRIPWRGLVVPVLSLELMCQLELNPDSVNNRMVIISNPGDDDELPYAGLQIKGTPRSYMAAEADLPPGRIDNLCPYMQNTVQMDEEIWLLPNLELIFRDLKAELKKA